MTDHKVLHLPLKKEWYNLIESGVKTEEYREYKPYWIKRFIAKWVMDRETGREYPVFVKYKEVEFSYGYTKRRMNFKIDKITIGYGKPEWGAPLEEEVFIIKLGRMLK